MSEEPIVTVFLLASGALLLSTVDEDNYLRQCTYYGYTKEEAIERFTQEEEE